MLGAVANKRPDLFQAMILQVPFVDVSTTMLDATLPLTMHEYDEWGNPSADPAVRDYLRGYSPCDNIVGLSEEAPAAWTAEEAPVHGGGMHGSLLRSHARDHAREPPPGATHGTMHGSLLPEPHTGPSPVVSKPPK